jgi:hypothetical protein
MKFNTATYSTGEMVRLLTAFTVFFTLSTPQISGMAIIGESTDIIIIDSKGFSITWEVTNQAVALNGVHMDFSTYDTLDKCQKLCIDDLRCVAIEFDTSSSSDRGCWEHTNPNDLLPLYDGGCCDDCDICANNYKIIRTAPVTTIEAPNEESTIPSDMQSTMAPVNIKNGTADMMSSEGPSDTTDTENTINMASQTIQMETNVKTASVVPIHVQTGTDGMMSNENPLSDVTQMSDMMNSNQPGVSEDMNTGKISVVPVIVQTGTVEMMSPESPADMTDSGNTGNSAQPPVSEVTMMFSDQESVTAGNMMTGSVAPVKVGTDMTGELNSGASDLTMVSSGTDLTMVSGVIDLTMVSSGTDLEMTTTVNAGQHGISSGTGDTATPSFSDSTDSMMSGSIAPVNVMTDSTGDMMTGSSDEMMTDSSDGATGPFMSQNPAQPTDATGENFTGSPPMEDMTGTEGGVMTTVNGPVNIVVTDEVTSDDNSTDFSGTTLPNSGRTYFSLQKDLLSIAVALTTAWLALVSRQL